MPPLLRASQIGKGVKLAATYLWRGRDAISHEDSPGSPRSRGGERLRRPPFLQSTSQLSGPTLIFDPGHRPGAPPRFWKERRPRSTPSSSHGLATPSPVLRALVCLRVNRASSSSSLSCALASSIFAIGSLPKTRLPVVKHLSSNRTRA